jgi:hypothetical protein
MVFNVAAPVLNQAGITEVANVFNNNHHSVHVWTYVGF